MKQFKTFKEYKDYFLTHPFLDVVKIGEIIYTMDFYDREGKEMSYGNKRTQQGFYIYTENRYKTKEDAEFELWVNGYSIRGDISYYD